MDASVTRTIIGLAIPLAGTTAGAAMVFLMRGRLNHTVDRALTGFAAGVMVAASVWSLIVPAIE
ncbi:MAG: ZIP family metal transporter, partial [Parafannyhessea umbonata]|nr:ZIP family metal transporter [Parafannyhessea umbonata]